MKSTIYLITFVLAILVSERVSGQASVHDLDRYLKTITQNPSAPIPRTVFMDAKNEAILVRNLIKHRNDTGDDFQFHILDLMKLIGAKSKDQDVRNSVVSHLVKTISDKNLRISGVASDAVCQFFKPDFSAEDKDSIVSYLRVGMPNLDALFRLAGYLEIPAAKSKISAMLVRPISPILKWNARLALARLGDDAATNFVLEKITTSTIDDSFVPLIPGLVYTRNAKVFFELEKIIQSDVYNCRSSHPDSKSTVLCAYRVLECVAGAIEEFPIKVDESGDMLVDNYQSALETARRWFKHNPEYKFRTNTM